MRQYAIPCIISLLVGALYNIVDQIFIANASYLGSYGNAANTVVFPLTVVALAIAVMVGDGCCAFVSMALGRNEVDKAKRSVGNAVVLSVVSSLVLTAVYLIFANSIIAMFGGTVNEETFRHSQEYFFYITLGIPFYMFGQAMNPIIRADGNPKFAMISTLAGAVINIILDPIFIFVFKWGMMGAAVATVIGQVATAFLAVWYLLHMKIIKPASGDYALRGTVCGRMLTLGITSFLSQISLVAAMAAINNMLRKYGALDAVFGQEQYAQIPMAVVGIVMKFFQIVISIVVGMAAGCIPIVGYNMGAEKKLRVRELFTRLLIAEALVGAVALVLAEGFPRQLIAIFGAANESSYYTDFAIKAFRTYLCMMVLACVNKACFIFLQAVGKALTSTLLSMFREVVFGVGFALLLPVFFGLDGVLYSMPVSDILTFIISAIIIVKTYRELNAEGVQKRMKNRVITISREFGSGGRTIGKKVAEKLGIPCYDAEIIQEMAKETGFAPDYVKEAGEYAPGSFLSAAFSNRMFGPTNEDILWEHQYKVITELAEKGPCVIVGRCADYILQDKADCLKVFIHADMEFRAERIVEVYGEREQSPEERLRDKDKRRAAYHRFYTNMKWGHAQNYHLTLDSGVHRHRQVRGHHRGAVLKTFQKKRLKFVLKIVTI